MKINHSFSKINHFVSKMFDIKAHKLPTRKSAGVIKLNFVGSRKKIYPIKNKKEAKTFKNFNGFILLELNI